MRLYDKIIQYSTNLGLREPIKEGNWDDFLKADRIKDVKSGDVIQIKGKEYLYHGMWSTEFQKTFCKNADLYIAYFNSPLPNGKGISVFKDFSFWKKVGHMSKEKWIKESKEKES